MVLEGHDDIPLISFSLDGKHVLTIGNESSRVWSKDGRLLGIFQCRYAEFSSDGRHIVAMTNGNTAAVYRVPQ